MVTYRKQKAYYTLKEAKDVAELGHWNLVGNRLYYAVFHMASALLLDKGFVARTHSGVIHLIGKEFISAGFLDRKYGRLLSRLYELRQSGDYDDMFDATEEEVFPFIERTEDFLAEMSKLITLV